MPDIQIPDSGFRIPDLEPATAPRSLGICQIAIPAQSDSPEFGIRNQESGIQESLSVLERLVLEDAALGYFLNQHLEETDKFSDMRAHFNEIGCNGQSV